MPGPDLSEPALAKINLCLHILGRREDGYHELDSLIAFADVGERVVVEPGRSGADLEIDGPFAGALAMEAASANLVQKAAEAIADSVRDRSPLRLRKHIPVSAGLGGGSADAAAVLRLLNRVHALEMSEARLAEIGASLGADIPMCVHSRPLRAGGRGEIIEPVPSMPALPLVLVHPGVAVATAAVFAGLAPPFDPPISDLPSRFDSGEAVAQWLRQTRNTLRLPAIAIAPAIAEALASLEASDGNLFVQMSGSGATCFAIFADQASARLAVARITELRPDWWVRAVTTVASESAD